MENLIILGEFVDTVGKDEDLFVLGLFVVSGLLLETE